MSSGYATAVHLPIAAGPERLVFIFDHLERVLANAAETTPETTTNLQGGPPDGQRLH